MNIACVLNISVFSLTYTHNIVWFQKIKSQKNTIHQIFVSQMRMKSMKQMGERVNVRSKQIRRKIKKTTTTTPNECEECAKAAQHKKINLKKGKKCKRNKIKE